MDLAAFIAHIEKADPGDRAALIQRVAALAWREGHEVGLNQTQTDDYPENPYREQ